MSRSLICLCALLVFVAAPSVKADTVVITGGSISLSGFAGPTTFNLLGDNFSMQSTAEPGVTLARNCFPCQAGSFVGTLSFFSGTALGSGSLTFNGINFPSVFFAGALTLSAPQVQIPSVMHDVTLQVPFTLSGSLLACSLQDAPLCNDLNAVFSMQLAGGGAATVAFSFFQANGMPLFSFSSIRYNFGTSVPEPVTLLLLGSGLVGLGARFKLSKRCRSPH